MSNLTRTLGFKTTELFFQQVISAAGKQGLTKSDFVRNAVEAAVEKATTGFQAALLDIKPIVKTANEIPKFEAKPTISSPFLEQQIHELKKQIILSTGLTKLLECVPFFIRLGGSNLSSVGNRS